MNPDGSSATASNSTLGVIFLAESRTQLEASFRLIKHCVDQLTDDAVWRRQHESLNSIGNLLLHLAGNLTQRFGSGIGGAPDRRDRPREFTERTRIPKAELLSGLEAAVTAADALLSTFDPAKLTDLRPYATLAGNAEISVLAVIYRTLVHLNGHAQEVLSMTRGILGDGYVFQNPAEVPKRPTA